MKKNLFYNEKYDQSLNNRQLPEWGTFLKYRYIALNLENSCGLVNL